MLLKNWFCGGAPGSYVSTSHVPKQTKQFGRDCKPRWTFGSPWFSSFCSAAAAFNREMEVKFYIVLFRKDGTKHPPSECLTSGGKDVGKPCVFPFKKDGVEYSACTYNLSYALDNK